MDRETQYSIPSRTARVGRISISAVLVIGLLVQFGLLPFLKPQAALAFSNSWTFDTAGDYSVTANKIKVTGGQAQLARTPDWWNTSYAYRKRMTVTAGSTAIATSNTITLKTDVAALVTAGKVQADQDDLRVVYWNGSTNANIDRDYLANGLNETLNSGASQNDIRFKAQAAVSASGSDSGYYLYYGYAGATAGPNNPANVYQYYEPFSTDVFGGTPTWVEINSTRWSWNSGLNRLSHGSTNTSDERAAFKDGNFDTTKSWYFETIAQRTSASNATGLGVSNMSANDSAPTLGWRMTTAASGDVELWKDGGSWIDNTGVGTVTISQNTDYLYTVRHLYSGDPTCDADWATGAAWVAGAKYNEAGVGRDNLNASNCPATVNPTVYNFNATATFDDMKGWQYLNESLALGSEETTYPNDDPTVQPVSAVTFDRLDSFTETSTLNGGSIRYVLSNDGGTTWKYQNGVAWVNSNGTYAQSNTASEVNTNATTFPAGSRQLLYQAFLRSDGTQLVQLDTVTINGNRKPNQATLTAPASGATTSTVTPTLTVSATDDESDYVRYRLDIDTVNTFNSTNLRTYDQATSQTGWSGQNAQSSTAYASGATASFTLPTALAGSTTYYWRAAAIDPGGVNTLGASSASGSFTTPATAVASGIQASTITTTSAIILWSTNIAATSSVQYGTTTSYGSTASVTGTRTTHQVALSNLQPATSYHYRVTGTDSTGQTYVSADQTFTTLGNTVITNVQSTRLSSKSIKITWTTNHLADTKVRYGKTTAYGLEYYNATRVLEHAAILTDLEADAAYHYEVLSVGNTSTNDADATFLTMAVTPTVLRPTASTQVVKGYPFKVIGLASSGQTVTLYIDGVEEATTTARTTSTGTGDFSFTVTKSLDNGSHAITVKGTSTVAGQTEGNDSPVSEAVDVTVVSPSLAPTVTGAVVHNDGSTITVTGVAPSGATLGLIIDGKEVKTFTAPTSSKSTTTFSVSVDLSTYGPGDHTVKVVSYDENNKPSKEKTAATVTIDEDGALEQMLAKALEYVVLGGDSLWKIAQKFYGNGARYPDLVDANKDAFPSLASNPSLILPGWKLTIPK